VVVKAVKKPKRPLAGVNVMVCLKEEKGGKQFQEKPKKGLDRADIVRDGEVSPLTRDFLPSPDFTANYRFKFAADGASW